MGKLKLLPYEEIEKLYGKEYRDKIEKLITIKEDGDWDWTDRNIPVEASDISKIFEDGKEWADSLTNSLEKLIKCNKELAEMREELKQRYIDEENYEAAGKIQAEINEDKRYKL